jgi:cell division protein FtsB
MSLGLIESREGGSMNWNETTKGEIKMNAEYPGIACESLAQVEQVPQTLREQLEKKIEKYKQNIEQIQATIKLMDDNPGFEKVHDAISRLSRLGLR